MPYVTRSERLFLDADLGYSRKPGQLNYQITKLCTQFMPETRGYADYNTIIGVLECVKLEFYRRAVTPYEDQKIKENGDVY